MKMTSGTLAWHTSMVSGASIGVCAAGAYPPGKTLDVEVRRLDDLVEEMTLPTPAVVKIDVEGGEAHVIEGASRILSEWRPTILAEVHNVYAGMQMAERLEGLGYLLRVLGKNHWLPACLWVASQRFEAAGADREEKERLIRALKNQGAAGEANNAKTREELLAKDRVIQELFDVIAHKDAAIREITHSTAWWLVNTLRGCRLVLAPSGTRRERIWKKLVKQPGRIRP